MKRKVALLLVVLLVLQPLWPILASAQEPVRAGVVTTLAGRATVARAALPSPLDLKFKDDVFVQDRIRTEQNSVVRMLMGGKAVVTVRELSELTITEEATRSTVNLETGKIALSVARQRMRPGEAIEIRTPNAIAGVRGTVVIAEIIQASAQGPGPAPIRTPVTTNWYVLRGSIDVLRRDALTAPPTRVNQLQSLSMTGTTVGPVRPIPPQQVGQILSGLQAAPPHQDTPEGAKKDVGNKEQAKATALASLIAPERGPVAPKKEEEGKKEEGKKEEKGGGEQQQQQQQQAAAAEQPPSGPPTGPPPTGGTDTGTPPPVAATAPPTPPPVDLPVFTAPPPAPPVVAPPPAPTILPPVTAPLPTAPTPLVTINGLSVALGATGQLITVTSGTANQVTATVPPLPPPFVVATGPSPSISGPLGGPTVQLTGASVTATAGGPALATVTGTTTSATAALLSASGILPAASFTIDSARPLLGLASLATIGSALTLTGGASASFSGDAINLTTGVLTTTGDLFGVGGASSLSVGGSLLTLPSGTPAVSVGGAVASVVGSTLTGSATGTPLIKVLAGSLGVTRNLVETASTLSLTGPVLTVGGGRTVTAGGGLKAIGSTVTFTGTELVNLSGGSTFSAAGPFLDLTNTTLALGTGSGARLSVGSMAAKNTLTNTVGPPVRLTGSALTGTGALITTDGTGNTVSFTGSLELVNSSVSLGTLASIGTGDTFTQALATGDATVKMTNSSLTLGPPTALNLLAPLARIDGVNGTLAAPNYITLTGPVNLDGANDLITLASLGVSLAEPVLKATGNTLTLPAGGSLLGVSGTATSTTTSPLISLDPVTVSAGGDLFRIKPTGSLSVAGALVSDTSGSLVVFGNFLTVQGGLTATGTPALIQLTGSTVSSGFLAGPTHFVQITGATGQATLGGPLLTASGTFSLTQGGSAVLEVSSGGKLTGSSTSPFISLTGGILGLGSGVTATLIETGSTATLAGGLFKAVSTTISLPATPGPFLQVTGASSLTVAGPFIDLTSTLPATLSLGTAPLAKVLGGSTLKNSAGAAVKLSGVSLTADSLLNTDGAANIIDSAGILDLTDGTVTLRRLLDPPSPSTDKFRSSRALNQPAISVTSTLASSTLTTTTAGDGLVFLGDGSLATLPTEQGVALVATATGLLTTTINVKGLLVDVEATTYTATNALAQLTKTTVNQTLVTPATTQFLNSLILIDGSGKSFTMAGPMLRATNATLNVTGPEVFNLENGTLTNTSASAFFNLDPTTITAPDFGRLGKGGNLTLAAPFLADVGGTINISNTSVNTVANTVTVGTSPSAIALTADGARAYVANATSNTVSVVDSVTRTVTATVAVGTDPEGVAVKPDGSRVYVANKGSGTVSVIDAGTNTVIGSPITVGSSPNSVAVTPDGAQAYVANVVSNNVSVINTATNAVVATVPVGTTPAEVFIAPNGARAYVRNNGSANVSVINTATNAVIATVPVGANPEFIAFDPASGRAFVANQGATTVSVIDNTLATPALLTTITVGTAPNAIAITPEGNKAYVANGGSGTVSVIDTRTNAVLATVTVGTSPQVPAVSPDGTRVYVPNAGSGSVSVIETKTNTVIATVTVGTSPDHVAIGPNGALAFVKNTGSSNLSVIDVNKGSFLTLGPGATFKTTGTAAFVDLSGTTMTFGGGLFRSLSATTTLGGPAFKASGVTLTAGGPLIDLDASSFTAAGSILDLSGSTVNLGSSPVAFLKNKSTLKSTSGPTIKIVGGSLTADSLGLTNGNGNTFDLTGTVLDATSTTISLRTIGDSPDNDTNTDKFTRTLNQPFMKLTSTTLTTTLQNRDNLVDLGDNDPVTPPTEPGVALIATGTVASLTTITLSNRLFKLKAGTFTATNPLAQIDHTNVNQTVTLQSLVRIDPSTKSITMTGPLFNGSDATFGTTLTPLSGSMFSFENGSAAGVTANSTTTPFITMARDTVTTSRHFVDAFSNFVLTLQNSLLSATDTTVTTTSTSFSYFAVVDGSKITTTVTTAPLLSFTGTAASLAATTSKVTAARNFLPLAVDTMGAAAPSMTLSGPLLTATLTAFKTGDPTANTNTFLFVGDSAQLTSTSTSALMSFTNSSVDTAGNILTLRRSATVATPSKVTLSGPLFTATGSTFDTTSLGFGAAFSTSPSACCAGFSLHQGAQLTSSAAAPLIQLTDSMFNSGPDAQSGGSFLILRDTESGFPATELVAPASVNLTNAGGSLLSVTNNGASTNTLSALFSLLNVQRSSFTSSGTGALITFGGTTGPTVTLGGTDPTITATPTTTFGRLVTVISSATGGTAAPSNASITLAGQLLNSTKASITTTSDLVGVINGATFTSSSTLTTPLVQVTNTTLNLGTASQNGFVFNVSGLGGTSGTSLATLNSSGPLLDASSGSPITATGGLLNVFAGGQVVMGTALTPTTLPLFSITGGTHTLSSNAGTAAGRFTGRATATASEVDDGVTLTLGTDTPVTNHNGAELQATGATITAQKAVKLDTALISASAPLLILQSASSFTSALDAIDLPQKAKLVSTGPIVKLDGSTLTVTSGAGVNVAGASLLRVIGDLIDIRNGGTLKVLAGPALNVTGNSVVNISGALVAFNGTSGNSVQITNTLCAPCTSFSGIPVFLTGGALSSNVTIGPNPIKNLSTLGTVTLSSPILTTGGTAVIAVSGASSKVTITAP